jgi:hypothetical protein
MAPDASARPALGGFGETLKLDARSLNHPLQVEHKLGIHGIVGSSEGVQRCRAGGVEDPNHAQLLKGDFVDTRVFLSCGGQNHLGARLRPASVDISSGSGLMPTRPRSRRSGRGEPWAPRFASILLQARDET